MKKTLITLLFTLSLIACSDSNKSNDEKALNNETQTSTNVAVADEGFELSKTLPEFTLTDLDGNSKSSKEILGNGKKTLFSINAEW